MTTSADRALGELALHQHGVFTRDDARRLGLSSGVLARRLATGQLLERHPDVLSASSTPYGCNARFQAALLAAGPLAMLSHDSAALLWSLVSREAPEVWITLPFRCRLPALKDVVVVRSRHTEGIRRTRWGFPVTSPSRTWVDLGRTATPEVLESALATGLQRKLITLPQVDGVLAVAHHRAGTQLVRQVLARYQPEWESVLSAAFGRLVLAAGIDLAPGWAVRDETGEPLAVLDFADVARRLAFEVDGWAYHGSKWQQQQDKQRDRMLLARGWVTVRFTTDDILRRPQAVIAEVRSLLAARAA